MNTDERKLENFIIDSGIVSREGLQELKKVAAEKQLSLGQAAVQKGVLSEDDVRRIQAYTLGVSFVDLKKRELDLDILSLIPEPISRSHNVVAFKKEAETLEVALLRIEDLEAIDFIKKTGWKILPRLTDSESMKGALISYQKALRLSFGDIIQKNSDNTNLVVDTLLKHALLQGASDIHIEPGETQVLVRYRLGGFLHEAMVLPQSAAPIIVARIKELSGLKPSEQHLPQDGRFRLEADGERVSFRVSTLPVYSGEKVVLRIFRENVSGFTLESLGFHGEGLEDLYQALSSTTGLILVAGPADSGRTTTLYTMLDLINQPHMNISTIEDPVEHQMPRINQVPVRSEVGLTCASGLRTLLRQDPDVVMVGEIRDAEIAALATQASLRGHLVLSALQCSSSANAVHRLLDMKVDPLLLVSSLRLVIVQRLVRKLGDNKEKYFLNEEELKSLGKLVSLPRLLDLLKKEKVVAPDATWDKIPFYKAVPGKGSDDGYAGRLGIQEVLRVTAPVKELVMKGATSAEVEKQAKLEGLVTLAEDGLFKAVQGLTTIEEVLRVTSLRL